MRATETVARFDMLREGDAVLAGVSGGADSMALLHFLCALRPGVRVFAAHINHGLRGEEALRDENFVRSACEAWGVELFVQRADVRAQAEQTGETVEEAGRRVRYAFFEQTADRLGAKIATAHTLSDSIETVLLNFARGTGLKGLCGIPPRRGRIIRPLIETSRSEVEAYCAENAISYINDSTNFSREFSRNRIRLDAVPVLYSLNPAFDRAAQRAMRSLREDEELLRSLTADWLNKARIQIGCYSLAALRQVPQGLEGRVVSMAAEEAAGVPQEAVHIERMCAILADGRGCVQIHGGCLARVAGGNLRIGKAEKPAETVFEETPFVAGMYRNPGFCMETAFLTKNEFENLKNINKQYLKFVFDCDRIKGKAVIRSRRPGDSYHPAGRGVTKTLKKLLNEAAVPPEARAFLPVISDQAGILWVYGFGPDERCRVTAQTKNFAYMKTTDVGGLRFG